jgi:enoyl-CoA hydratase
MSSSEKSTTKVELTKDGLVATIRFIPETGVNIFSSRVLGELGVLVQRVVEDGRIRFLVFRGDGRVFLAGADIAEMAKFTEDQGHAFATNGHNVFNAISALPQVTFAAINGHALGGGCELSLACDFRIMVAGAKIGLPETTLGLIPGWGGTQRLPKVVGDPHARRLIFAGQAITADEALKIALVDEVVATAEELDPALQRWFKLLEPASPHAITRAKRALLQKDEIEEFGKCFSCSDAKEGITAFLEKRKAPWVKAAGT